MTAVPFFEVRNLGKRFGSTEALSIHHPVNLELDRDELLVVLGPTGAGKTTLLRTIAGLEAPDCGHIFLEGREITVEPPGHRDFALVFQNFSLYPDKTVRQNLAFPLKAPSRKLTVAAINDRIEWAAQLLRITPLLDRKSNQLSGGEMQRVAIGRVIVRRPRLFLMDEPLSNLDAKLRETLRVELVELRRRLGVPMILVTHDQAEAMSMADRIVVLSDGRVMQTGTPQHVYRQPASPTVARQLGQPPINLIEVHRESGYWIGSAGTAVLPAESESAQRMILGVRPEDVALDGSSGGEWAKVLIVEELGAMSVILIDWHGQRWHVIAPKPCSIVPGDTVYPTVNAERVRMWPT